MIIDENESYLSFDFIFKIFLFPFIMYLLWALIYYVKIFVISSKRISERNYETMFVYYNRNPYWRKMFGMCGAHRAPLVFMSFHIGFFIFSSVFAIIGYMNFYVNTVLMLCWMTLSIWNGANFYMEWFSRKYESSLKKLELIEQELVD